MKNTTSDIMLRRNKVSVMLAEKQPLTKIANTLNVNYDVILEDKKAIQEQGYQFWYNITDKKYLAYNQYMIMISIDKVMSKCWNIVDSRNNKISMKDKLSAMRLILDAGNYQENLFVKTPELLTLKELEDKSNKLNTDTNDMQSNSNTNNKTNDNKRKRLIP
jgi:hypothetical protein